MLRTQISLTEAERALLDAKAVETGRSVAALIRDAVNQVYGADRSVADDLAAIRAAAGSWQRDDDDDGAAYVRRLRSGRRLADLA